MTSRPDLDAVVSHITTYARREPWPSLRHGHLVAFLEPVLDEYGLDLEGVFHEVHRLGHLASMSGFLDESFLSGEHGADRLNLIDDYLRRRGWQETPRAREYLQGIRNTPPTLFEVQDVAFGEWVDVRDRLGTLRVPTLIVQREGDRIVRAGVARYMAARIPYAELRLLPGEDHLLWAGDTATVLDALEDFVQRRAHP